MSGVGERVVPDQIQSYMVVPWRWISLIGATLAVGAITALLVVVGLSDSSLLATVALALAVVAFIVQVVVFVAQLSVSNQQMVQSERLNAQTRDLLTEIRAAAVGMEAVQKGQFERLLDHALGQVSDEAADISEDLGSIRSELEMYMTQEEADELRDRFQEIDSRLRGLSTTSQRQYTTETVTCPYCGAATVVERIGTIAGDSAHPTCENCGQGFHAHRDGSGKVFTRKPGQTSHPATLSVGTGDLQSWAKSQLARSNMELPEPAERLQMLERVFDAWKSGTLTTAGGIREVAGGNGRINAKTGAPLFYAMVNLDYGVLPLSNTDEHDQIPLRNRRLVPYAEQSRDEWLTDAHAAWLAQAVYRLGRFGLTTEELSQIFFGESADRHASLLNTARRCAGA
jgi:hypothetical protein